MTKDELDRGNSPWKVNMLPLLGGYIVGYSRFLIVISSRK